MKPLPAKFSEVACWTVVDDPYCCGTLPRLMAPFSVTAPDDDGLIPDAELYSPGHAYQRISTRTPLSAFRNCVSTVSHPRETLAQHRHLRGHTKADRCRVKSLIGSALMGFGVRQRA
jgi:hypothetical protein